jgi:hypothetical protein
VIAQSFVDVSKLVSFRVLDVLVVAIVGAVDDPLQPVLLTGVSVQVVASLDLLVGLLLPGARLLDPDLLVGLENLLVMSFDWAIFRSAVGAEAWVRRRFNRGSAVGANGADSHGRFPFRVLEVTGKLLTCNSSATRSFPES